jgi:cysteine-rich repeat protein
MREERGRSLLWTLIGIWLAVAGIFLCTDSADAFLPTVERVSGVNATATPFGGIQAAYEDNATVGTDDLRCRDVFLGESLFFDKPLAIFLSGGYDNAFENIIGATTINALTIVDGTVTISDIEIVPEKCGNGRKDSTEQCDDGNTAAGDGCSSVCTTEPGFDCNGSPSVCDTICGDGILAGSEQCDDGNGNNFDDCPDGIGGTCQTAFCGDGFVYTGTESCDDGNSVSADGCSAACTVEPGYVCVGQEPSVCNTPEPTVTNTMPSNGSIWPADTAIAVNFSIAMDPSTLTAQTSSGACSGSVQVSVDDFADCIAFSSFTASMSAGDTTATFSAAPGLLVNRIYKIRVTTAAQSMAGVPLAAPYISAAGFATTSPDICNGSVVISQVFGGGGSSAGLPNADYIELHNRGSSAVSMTDWSVQYASAAGSTWSVVSFSGTIPPGEYFLVRTQAIQPTGTALPTPDVADTAINLSGTAGKVALVSNSVALTGGCPVDGAIVDFIGYGTTATCWEGIGNAPATSSSTAEFRNRTGCADVDDNSGDFTIGTPAPRNSASPAADCACTAMNESDDVLEADYCNVQYPSSLSVSAGSSTGYIYGQIYEAGITEAAGPNPDIRAQIGWGLPTKNPQYEPWNWTNAAYSTQAGGNDEYAESFTAPASGSYRYVFRFSLDQGVTWTYCDNNNVGDFGSGSNPGLLFSTEDEPVLIVP